MNEQAAIVIKELTDDLNGIESIERIDESQFVSYRLLTYLYTLVSPKDSIDCNQLLGEDKSEIEDCLRNGMRTGILGAFFSGRLYCFLNNHTVTKKDRGYFASPLIYKEHKDWYIVVALERTKIPLRDKEDWVTRCSIYYDAIKDQLTT